MTDTLRAVIWDMDGTLVDSEPRWGEATYAMAAAMGRPLTTDVRALTVGGTTDNTVRVCAKHAGLTLSPAEHEHWREWMFRTMEGIFAEPQDFRPGMPDLLQDLADAGIAQALVTNTVRRLTRAVLPSIGADFFTHTVCGDEVASGKPAPDPYLRALELLDLPAAACLVVEDSTTGMTAARDAGCRVLGVPCEGSVQVPAGVLTIADLLPGRRDLGGMTGEELCALAERIPPGAVPGVDPGAAESRGA